MIDTIVDYFTNGEWVGQILTSFVALFVPLASLTASLIGKYKNSASKALKEFKDQYENEMRADMELLKNALTELEQNLIEIEKNTETAVTNSAKTMAINTIAYTNSNLTASTKNEIMSIAKSEDTAPATDTIDNANAVILANEELDKVDAPAVLEEIANEVTDNEQNTVVL